MIVVDAAEKPIITLTGTENIARNEHNYTRGVKMFQTVSISSQTRKEQEEMGDEVSLMTIQCLVIIVRHFGNFLRWDNIHFKNYLTFPAGPIPFSMWYSAKPVA